MKIKTKTLIAFLKKFRMSGLQRIEECVLRFEKDGLHINANSNSKQSKSVGWLKTAAFSEYDVLGNVGVNDLSNIIDVLERFGDDAQISKAGNLLTVVGEKKKVEIELVSEDFLGNDTAVPDLKFSESFTIVAKELQDIFSDVEASKNVKIIITTIPKGVVFSNTGKYKFTHPLVAENCAGGSKSSFGQPLVDCLSKLDGALTMSISNDYPCMVVEKSEMSEIVIICAPVVDSE